MAGTANIVLSNYCCNVATWIRNCYFIYQHQQRSLRKIQWKQTYRTLPVSSLSTWGKARGLEESAPITSCYWLYYYLLFFNFLFIYLFIYCITFLCTHVGLKGKEYIYSPDIPVCSVDFTSFTLCNTNSVKARLICCHHQPPWLISHDMTDVFGHDSAQWSCTGPGTTWDNEMHFGMNHAPGAGSITRAVDLQSCALSLCYSCPLPTCMK